MFWTLEGQVSINYEKEAWSEKESLPLNKVSAFVRYHFPVLKAVLFVYFCSLLRFLFVVLCFVLSHWCPFKEAVLQEAYQPVKAQALRSPGSPLHPRPLRARFKNHGLLRKSQRFKHVQQLKYCQPRAAKFWVPSQGHTSSVNIPWVKDLKKNKRFPSPATVLMETDAFQRWK